METRENFEKRPALRRDRAPDPEARRHPLIRAILARLRVMQPTLLVGERLNGRSLLLETVIPPDVMREYKCDPDDFTIAWITGADILNCTVESFWLELILPQFRAEICRQNPRNAELIRECEEEGFPFGVDEALYRIRKKLNKKPLIAWDGFELVPNNSRLDESFFAQLRAQSQTYELSFLIGSSKPFEALGRWTMSTSPFFNIFYTVDMEQMLLAL